MADLGPEEILKAIERQREAETPAGPEPERVQYLGFCLGKEVYALPLRRLREVAPLSQLRRVPGAPAVVAGLVNLRGEIICALDPRVILNVPDVPASDKPYVVVLHGAEEPLGLVVDAITDVHTIAADEIVSPLATWPAERAQFFIGTVRAGGSLMALVDVDRMMAL